MLRGMQADLRPNMLTTRLTSSQTRRTLPTVHDIRRFGTAELEDARLDLSQALSIIPPFTESLEPRRGELLRLLASTHLRLGDAIAAEEALDDARDIDDRHQAMHGDPPDGGLARRETSFLLGVAYQKSGREAEARQKFEAVLSEDDGHFRARFHLALLCVSKCEYVEAESMLARVLVDSPDHATASDILARLRERRAAEANELAVPDDEKELAALLKDPAVDDR